MQSRIQISGCIYKRRPRIVEAHLNVEASERCCNNVRVY